MPGWWTWFTEELFAPRWQHKLGTWKYSFRPKDCIARLESALIPDEPA